MGYFAIRIGLLYRVVEGNDERDAIESLYESLHLDWESVDDLMVDAIRPATVRETFLAEYGDDWKRSIDHLGDLVNTYRTEGVDVFVLNHAQGKDAFGYDDVLPLANYRVLYENWSSLDSDVLFTNTHSNVDTIGIKLDVEAPADLVDVLKALSEYPVLDDHAYSEVEMEEIEDHWNNYGKDEVLDAVAKAIGADNRTDLTDEAESLVKQLVWEGILDYGCGGGYPSFIDSSAVDFGAEAVAAFIRDNVGKRLVMDDEHWRLKDVTGSVADAGNWERTRTVVDLTVPLIAE